MLRLQDIVDIVTEMLAHFKRPRKSVRHFSDNIFKSISFNKNCCILIFKSDCKGPMGIMSTLERMMAWYRTDNKPLSESIKV